MRIAFLSSSADRKNGWGSMTVEICSFYYSHGMDFIVFLPGEEKNKHYINELPFKKHINFNLPPFAYSFRNPVKLWKYFKPFIYQGSIDIIHALDFPYAISALMMSASKIPYVVTLCGTFYKPMYFFPDHFLFNLAYKRAANINMLSQFTLTEAKRAFNLPDEKLQIIHPGVNYHRFKNQVNISDLSMKFAGKKIILGVGGLKKRKGFDTVIRSMVQVKKAVPNAVYIIVGGGTDGLFLHDLITKLNLESAVFLVGEKNDDDLSNYFQLADVYCHTPRFIDGAFEGFGIVYLEAGAAGKPVVASRSGGVPDAVLDGKTGLLVPENDIEATAEALIKILKNNELARTLGAAGREYAKIHDWAIIAGEYINLYKRILAK